jgi:hypothetical protein
MRGLEGYIELSKAFNYLENVSINDHGFIGNYALKFPNSLKLTAQYK